MGFLISVFTRLNVAVFISLAQNLDYYLMLANYDYADNFF